ncbi:iron-containing redox enzyme family protein [Actinoplanes sp. TBRC 11911]|uniref:iron-containing redox enzyme family protein n=1 Tax=Actinoplanes sp. TBRC 11911 TaxID=2729386 RepID=UPI00145E7280|nr:iron-containing redox enzyme family protein [Actinoplanes sp. TBRC 11911]NMO53703.1 iron-containing redox enzyme family protein [Actinoplanes sp. TBRC 11911]
MLHHRVAEAILAGDGDLMPPGGEPVDRRDRVLTLLQIYELHIGPAPRRAAGVRLQHHPRLAEVKCRLEMRWLAELDAAARAERGQLPADPVEALRRLAALDRLPSVYRWVAQTASWADVVEFLTLEGGPDGGFDDLVALCQLGLPGVAKVELARNYWDEMGNGVWDAVHSVLYRRFADAVGIVARPADEQPLAALERQALGGLLGTNRWLQPEMLGALGLIELQAGPRCQLVVQAFERCGAPADAYPFYVEHARTDPRHGVDWLEHAVRPVVAQLPEWGDRIVHGAIWRAGINQAFLAGFGVGATV